MVIRDNHRSPVAKGAGHSPLRAASIDGAPNVLSGDKTLELVDA